MNTIIDAGSARLAGLQIDTLSKYRAGQITLDQWERFNNLTSRDREIRFGGNKNNEPNLLLPLGTVLVPPTTSPFSAKDSFKLKRDGGICSYLGDNLKAWFLNGDGKIEPPFTGSTLQYAKLRKAATDMPQNPGEQAIIPELGGETKVETSLTEMFSLMEKQKHGEDGVLLNNGYANIFYVKDLAGVLRAVDVGWDDESWSVGAFSIGDADGWVDGSRVFSRNSSVLESSEPLA